MKGRQVALALLLAACALLCGGCGQSAALPLPRQADNWLYSQTDTVATGQGLYRRKDDGLAWYLDWDTATERPLCTLPGCPHQDESCPAWLGAGENAAVVLLCARDTLLAAVPAEGEVLVRQLDPAGRQASVLARCPLPENSVVPLLLWYDGASLWFAGDAQQGESAGTALWRWDLQGQCWQREGLLSRPLQRFYYVRDGSLYLELWDYDTRISTVCRWDLAAGRLTELCQYDPEWQRVLLREDTLYLADRRGGCAIYTKSLLDTAPPTLRCRLPQLGEDSFATLCDADGDRVVVQWGTTQWAVDLVSGDARQIRPVAMYGLPTPGQQPFYPEYDGGQAAGAWALCVGYWRQQDTLSVAEDGAVSQAVAAEPVWCCLDRDAYLDGSIRLAEAHPAA